MSNNIERIKKYIYSILSKEEFITIQHYYKELREKRAEYDDLNEISFFFSFALIKDLFENYEVKQMIKNQKELEYSGILEYLFLKLFKFLDINIGLELYYDIIIKVYYLIYTFNVIKDEKMLLYYLNQLYYNEETYSRNWIKYIHDSKITQIINYINNQIVHIGELGDNDLRLKDIFESIEKLVTRKLMKVNIEETVIKKYFKWLINSEEIDLDKKVVRFEKYQGDKYNYDIPLKYDDDINYEDYISKYSKDEYIHDINKTADKKVIEMNKGIGSFEKYLYKEFSKSYLPSYVLKRINFLENDENRILKDEEIIEKSKNIKIEESGGYEFEIPRIPIFSNSKIKMRIPTKRNSEKIERMRIEESKSHLDIVEEMIDEPELIKHENELIIDERENKEKRFEELSIEELISRL